MDYGHKIKKKHNLIAKVPLEKKSSYRMQILTQTKLEYLIEDNVNPIKPKTQKALLHSSENCFKLVCVSAQRNINLKNTLTQRNFCTV